MRQSKDNNRDTVCGELGRHLCTCNVWKFSTLSRQTGPGPGLGLGLEWGPGPTSESDPIL